MSEMDCLDAVMRGIFCREWDSKRDKNSITFIRDTGDHKETIRVTRNDLWDVTVKIMDRQKQIFTPTSYNRHHIKQIQPSLIPLIDRTFNKTVEYFATYVPEYSSRYHTGTLVEKESCNIGKKHNHFYISQFVSVRISDVHNIMPFLKTRYGLFSK